MGFWDKAKGFIKKQYEKVKEFVAPTQEPIKDITTRPAEVPTGPAAESIKAIDQPTEFTTREPRRAGERPPVVSGTKAAAQAKAGISPSGWQNVKDVYQIALNPFSDDKIVATGGGVVFKTVAEYVANHPYTTALAIALPGAGFTTVEAGTGIGFGTGRAGLLKIGGRVLPAIKSNTKTTKLIGNYLDKH